VPPANPNLDVNVEVSVNKRFITNIEVKIILQSRYDRNLLGLSFKGKIVAQTTTKGRDGYEAILDDASDCRLKRSASCLKYLFANNRTSTDHGRITKSAPANVCGLTGSLTPENDTFTRRIRRG
jgi:hypothetical protein